MAVLFNSIEKHMVGFVCSGIISFLQLFFFLFVRIIFICSSKTKTFHRWRKLVVLISEMLKKRFWIMYDAINRKTYTLIKLKWVKQYAACDSRKSIVFFLLRFFNIYSMCHIVDMAEYAFLCRHKSCFIRFVLVIYSSRQFGFFGSKML